MKCTCKGNILAQDGKFIIKRYHILPMAKTMYSVREGIKYLYMGESHSKAFEVYHNSLKTS